MYIQTGHYICLKQSPTCIYSLLLPPSPPLPQTYLDIVPDFDADEVGELPGRHEVLCHDPVGCCLYQVLFSAAVRQHKQTV